MKIAFAGASGTGKTTLMNLFVETADDLGFPLEVCNVGSREVIKELGLENPYDVDLLGKRKEFQHLLFEKKKQWEDSHKDFITDRTHLDNLVYSIMHDCLGTVSYDFMKSCIDQCGKYDLIVFCKMERFHHLGEDPLRVKDVGYHKVYETILSGLLGETHWKHQNVTFFAAWPEDKINVNQFWKFLTAVSEGIKPEYLFEYVDNWSADE
jgi:hypothetical protein